MLHFTDATSSTELSAMIHANTIEGKRKKDRSKLAYF